MIAKVIKRICQNPYFKYTVKELPKDAEYVSQTINDNKLFYSKSKESYYEVHE